MKKILATPTKQGLVTSWGSFQNFQQAFLALFIWESPPGYFYYHMHGALFVEGDPNQEPGSKGDGAVGEKKEGRKRDSQAVRNQKNKENLATLVNIFTIATMQYLCNILLRKKPRGVSHKKNGKVEVVEERGGGVGGGWGSCSHGNPMDFPC